MHLSRQDEVKSFSVFLDTLYVSIKINISLLFSICPKAISLEMIGDCNRVSAIVEIIANATIFMAVLMMNFFIDI